MTIAGTRTEESVIARSIDPKVRTPDTSVQTQDPAKGTENRGTTTLIRVASRGSLPSVRAKRGRSLQSLKIAIKVVPPTRDY